MCVSGFSVGLVDASKAEEVMRELRTLTEESQQVLHAGKSCGGVGCRDRVRGNQLISSKPEQLLY